MRLGHQVVRLRHARRRVARDVGHAHVVDALRVTRALLLGFLVAEAVSLLVSIAAVSRSPHDGLLLWVPTLFLYFPLGTLAAYKALWELIARPFYWDKTAHGHSAPDRPDADIPEDLPR